MLVRRKENSPNSYNQNLLYFESNEKWFRFFSCLTPKTNLCSPALVTLEISQSKFVSRVKDDLKCTRGKVSKYDRTQGDKTM